MMTDFELDVLEAAAKGATKGVWHCRRKDVFSRTADGDFPVVYDARYERDANYIAAANPAAVLDLIVELRQARADACEWKEATCPKCGFTGVVKTFRAGNTISVQNKKSKPED